jgi:manganese/zinc/iron transport system substrate-binding protein
MLLTGCAAPAQAQGADLSSRPIRVAATTGMVGDLVQNVGGERVQVTTLMGAGVDPHLYKASEGDVIRLGEADIIFYSGLHLEAGMGRVLERISEHGGRTVAVTQAIPHEQLVAPAQFGGNYDPHVWFDVQMWAHTIPVVEQALAQLDPAHAADYHARAQSYAVQLAALDAELRQMAAGLPAGQRVLITAHDAFNYFGRAYGFEVRGLQGISTSSEPGAGDVTGLVDFIVQRRIPAIFIESSVPMRNVQAVQAAAQARGWDVQIGGELFSDALGSPNTPEGEYIGMVRHNMLTIVQALKP